MIRGILLFKLFSEAYMVKKLLKSVGEYRAPSIMTVLFMVLEVACEVIIPTIMAKFIDLGIENQNVAVMVNLGIILVGMTLVSVTFGVLSGVMAAKASAGFAKNLRGRLYFKLQGYSFSNIDKYSGAGIVTRLTTDVTNIQNAYQMIIRIAVRGPLMLIFALTLSFTVKAEIAWIYLGVIVILGSALTAIVFLAHPYFYKVFRKYDNLNGVVQENLQGIRVVKSFNREEHEIEKFGGVSKTIYKLFRSGEKITAFSSPVMQACVYISMLLISGISAYFIVGGTMSTGDLTSLIAYAMQILMSLMMLSMVLVMIVIAKGSAERVVEMIDEQPDVVSPENAVTTVESGAVRFENVRFRYNAGAEKNVLEGINLDIPSGATVGIVGGTGSSKSSLVNLIARLYDVTDGSVAVGGVDVRNYDLNALRNSVSVVLQKNTLFSGSVAENLRWGDPNASDDEVKAAASAACADDFIEKFPNQYETHIEQGGTNVSGGQKQRLCIARALLKKPKILILDDSTSAVDTKTDANIQRELKNHAPDVTKFIIAQRISSVQNADMIVVLNEGKIENVGTHEELLECNEFYRDTYQAQMKKGGVGNE